MEIVIFILPFIVACFLFFFYRKETCLWEYVLLIVPSLLISLLIEYGMISYNTASTEYFGDYATKIMHYDAWNEYIHKTCTKRVPCGRVNNKTIYRTVHYDCSYVDEHPERWVMYTSTNNEIYIDKKQYNIIKDQWKTKEIFKDMHRKFHTKDGDAQYYLYDGNRDKLYYLTFPHSYENKVKGSYSIFNYTKISKKEAKERDLHDYPNVNDYYQQEQIIGYKNISDEDRKKIGFLNAKYGRIHQFRMYIHVYYNKDVSVSNQQESYWFGGNKNEFNVCIGLDSLTNKIQWANCFSWMDSPILEVKTRQYILDNDTLSIPNICDFVENNISLWKRKEFKDFNYINIELSMTQYIILLIIVLIYNIGISIYIIKNDFKNN